MGLGILRCVQLHGRGMFKPGDEEALEKAATETEIAYLKSRGVLVEGPAAPEAEAPPAEEAPAEEAPKAPAKPRRRK